MFCCVFIVPHAWTDLLCGGMQLIVHVSPTQLYVFDTIRIVHSYIGPSSARGDT